MNTVRRQVEIVSSKTYEIEECDERATLIVEFKGGPVVWQTGWSVTPKVCAILNEGGYEIAYPHQRSGDL